MTRHYYINQIKDLSTNFDDKTKSNILTELDKVKNFDSKGLKELYDLLYSTDTQGKLTLNQKNWLLTFIDVWDCINQNT